MSFGGSVSAMISSLKANSRRSKRSSIYDNNNPHAKKSQPLASRELTPLEKSALLEKIKLDHELEKKQGLQKLMISLVITVVVIIGIVYLLKFTFF